MNDSLLPATPTIKEWLTQATRYLQAAEIDSARLDAEIILAHTLSQPRTYLHAHPEETLDSRQKEIADARVDLRSDHVPIAYIIGHKEFYGRQFRVNSSTLIPRPESEDLINLTKLATELLEHSGKTGPWQIWDIGCGSGILGITCALEIPNSQITLSDISPTALKIAELNAQLLKAGVEIAKSDLLTALAGKPNIIVANLPYVDESWQVSKATRHEPEQALYAKDGGLSLIKKLLTQAGNRLNKNSYVVLEADPRQHQKIIEFAAQQQFSHIKTAGIGLLLVKS